MKLYVIRHGQTNSNKSNKLLGIVDEEINETGYKQIVKVGKKLNKVKIDVCFTSPLKRTMQTANIIIKNKAPILIDNRLIERGFGTLEGGSYNDKYTKKFWDYYLNKSDYEVEPLKDLFSRTKEFLDDIKKNYKDKCILIVSHAATIRAIHYTIVGFDKKTDMLSFKIDNGEILEYDL